MANFGDASEQKTPGPRGKTTRRKSTRTVRGPEGAYIAALKDEIATRPAGWVVWVEESFANRFEARTVMRSAGRFSTREEAEAYAATLPVGVAETFPMQTYTRLQVWVTVEAK